MDADPKVSRSGSKFCLLKFGVPILREVSVSPLVLVHIRFMESYSLGTVKVSGFPNSGWIRVGTGTQLEKILISLLGRSNL